MIILGGVVLLWLGGVVLCRCSGEIVDHLLLLCLVAAEFGVLSFSYLELIG